MFMQVSFGPIGWLMISEVFPLRLRGRGLSIAVLVNFGANALVTFAFSPLKVVITAIHIYIYLLLNINTITTGTIMICSILYTLLNLEIYRATQGSIHVVSETKRMMVDVHLHSQL